MVGRTGVLAIGLTSCAARHAPEISDDVSARHARIFVCSDIPNMLAIHVPEHIVENTVREALPRDTLSTTDLKCLDGHSIPDGVMHALQQRVRSD